MSYRVLLVDDDEDDFIFVRDLVMELPGRPIQLDWVSGYAEARTEITRRRHDAYLIDYRLGERNGLQLIQETRSEGGAPFIILTGVGDHDVDLAAMEQGASEYLIKGQLGAPLLERAVRYSINRAEQARQLKEREESVRSLFDSAFEGILVLDPRGRLLDANRTAGQILCDVPDKMRGQNLTDYLREDVVRSLLTTLEGPPVPVLKVLAQRKDGKTVHLELSAKRYVHRGQPAVLADLSDISERVQMESQILMQDRLASIGLLASSLAHEIGTPLGVMRGRAEFLQARPDDAASVHKNAGIIIDQIDRISKLIRSLLTLARGESAAVAVAVPVRRIVDEVLNLLGHELTRRQISFQLDLPPEDSVLAEPGPLHQVLLNLLVNAMHAIDEARGSGRTSGHQIRISLREEEGVALLSVQDTGNGIAPEHLKQIFTPFFTTKKIGMGTGLGLATCSRLVTSWGGSITVESEVGAGTSFKLRLRRPADRAASRAGPSS